MGRLWILSLALVPFPASAQDIGPTPEQVTERSAGFLSVWNALRAGESGLRIRLDPALVSSAKYNGTRLWWWRGGLALEGGLPVTKNLNLGISPSVAFEQVRVKRRDDFIISTSGRDSNVAEFIDAALNVGAKFDYDENWGAELVVRASARQEVGADIEDSLQIGGSLAATYRRGSWLRLRLGVGIGADLGDGIPRISPVYRLVLKPIPPLSLETSGLNGTVSYDLTPRTSLSVVGGLEGMQYNLERRSRPPAGLGAGTLQRRQTMVTLGVGHRVREWLRVRAELGIVFEQELSVIDSEGSTVDERIDKSASANARVRIEFRL